MGADDYVTKPFTTMELLARVNSHLRRYQRYLDAVTEQGNQDRVHIIGGLELNEDTVEVSVDGNLVKLTPIEFKILLLLMKNLVLKVIAKLRVVLVNAVLIRHRKPCKA